MLPQHRGLKDRTARAWPPPCPSFHRLSPFMHPECHRSPHRKGGPSAVAPGPPPPQASFPRLTAEPLWPASPRSPGTPTSPYTRGGGQRVSAGSAHTWVGGEGCRYSRGHRALLRGQPRPALQLCPAGEGGALRELRPHPSAQDPGCGLPASPFPPPPPLPSPLPSPEERSHLPVLLSHPWTLLVQGDPAGQRSEVSIQDQRQSTPQG